MRRQGERLLAEGARSILVSPRWAGQERKEPEWGHRGDQWALGIKPLDVEMLPWAQPPSPGSRIRNGPPGKTSADVHATAGRSICAIPIPLPFTSVVKSRRLGLDSQAVVCARIVGAYLIPKCDAPMPAQLMPDS